MFFINLSRINLQELGEPQVLLENHDGRLYQMIRQTGSAGLANLTQLAKDVGQNTSKNYKLIQNNTCKIMDAIIC